MSNTESIGDFLRRASSRAIVGAHSRAREAAARAHRKLSLGHLVGELLADPSLAVVESIILERARSAMSTLVSALPLVAGDQVADYSFDAQLLFSETRAFSTRFGGTQAAPIALLATCLTLDALNDPTSVKVREGLRAAGLTVEALITPPTPADVAANQDFTYQSLGFGRDLTAKARAGAWEGCPLIGMEEQLETLAMILTSGRDSIALVGEPGVGKSSLVNGLAWHIAHRTRPLIPEALDDLTLVDISMSGMLAGMSAEGELEERLEKMLDFFRKHKTVVPFFDEMHSILDSEDRTARRIANSLKQAMAEGQFRLIGVSTDREYARYITGDPALDSRFTRVLVPEPDEETAIEILEGIKHTVVPHAHRGLDVDIPRGTVEAVVRLTSEYQRGERLPRKALRLLRHVTSRFVYELLREQRESKMIEPADVAETFSRITGVPVDDLLADREEYYRRLERRLGERVFGQDHVLTATVSHLQLQARGWTAPRRPRGVFLYLGPPGTGKTELALALADELLRDRNSLIVKNMAEYRGDGARSKFMGSDPGYVGYGQVETIYSHVLLRPFSVVVLDEFEKASPDLANPLLSVLSGGGEDSQGRWVDFSQCIFVLTSNEIQEVASGDGELALRERLLERGGIFQAALVDRIDGAVVFAPLDRSTMSLILDSMVSARRESAARNLPTELEESETREALIDASIGVAGHPSARNLERALSQWLKERMRRELEAPHE